MKSFGLDPDDGYSFGLERETGVITQTSRCEDDNEAEECGGDTDKPARRPPRQLGGGSKAQW
jgi:hypothetical protein